MSADETTGVQTPAATTSAIDVTGDARLRANAAATLLPGFDGLTLPEWLRVRLAAGLGGVCLFGENVHSLDQLKDLTAAIRQANPNAIIAIDEEGGDVTRLFYAVGSPYPGNAVLGRIDDPAQTEAVAVAVGTALRAVGVNLDFAPDIDVNSNPDNPVIGVRSFGDDPRLVARHSAAWIHGLQSTGVAASAKHFPGHGDTATDSHRALPVVGASLDVLRSRELIPFGAAVDAGVRTIMTSHILLPALDAEHPATLSPRILGGLLRDELGFTGVIVSDALDMAGASGTIGIAEAAVQALAAGCDLLCIGTKNTDAQLADIERAVLGAVTDGRLDAARLSSAAAAVRALGDELSRARQAPSPHGAREVPPPHGARQPTATEVASTFDVSSEAQTWLRVQSPAVVVRLESTPNEAVGTAPWGPFAHLDFEGSRGVPRAPAWRPDSVITVTPDTATALAELSTDPRFAPARLVVVGRANHVSPWATRLIDTLRRTNDVLVVDMGWPALDHAYADIATFGASRLVGEALLDLLAGSSRSVQSDRSQTDHPQTSRSQTDHPLHDHPHHERLVR